MFHEKYRLYLRKSLGSLDKTGYKNVLWKTGYEHVLEKTGYKHVLREAGYEIRN